MSDDGQRTVQANMQSHEVAAAPAPVVRANRDRAMAMLDEASGRLSIAQSRPPVAAPAVAEIVSAARAAIVAALPWAGPGGELDTELVIEHTDAAGGRTSARMRFTFHR